MAHLMCREVVIFGSLDVQVIMLNCNVCAVELERLCGNVVISHCGVVLDFAYIYIYSIESALFLCLV
jgi:hypothetical protein